MILIDQDSLAPDIKALFALANPAHSPILWLSRYESFIFGQLGSLDDDTLSEPSPIQLE